MTDVRLNNFLDRLPANANELRLRVTAAFGVLDNYRARAREIRADNNLSPAGQSVEVVKYVSEKIGGKLKEIRAEIENPLKAIESEKIGLRREVTKSENFSEARKAEVRAWFRSLEHTDRMRLALESDDDLLREAIINVPCYLSNMQPDIYEKVIDSAVEQKFADRVAFWEKHEKPLREALTAVRVVQNEIERDMIPASTKAA